MTDQATDDQIDNINERGRALVDELYAALSEVCDRPTAYLSAMQLLLARSGLGVQEIVDAVTTLLGHNLCGDAPIRLAIVPAGDATPQPAVTKH